MKRALLVIDMQNDYLWDKRMNKFSYDTKVLVENVNKTIDKYKNDSDIIYISHLIQNIVTNRLLFGFSIEGSEGAKLYNKLNIVSDLKFDKYFHNAYTSKEFKEYMNSKNYDEVIVCGLDLCGCVYYTAMGALKYVEDVSIVSESTGCRYSKKKKDNYIRNLNKAGIKLI